ncbi:unnamed protein product [Acanthosepion pharaonis]|uniref:Uncharacterized protein n=1 Tax=Acanthosepion pharaonis TaxID=158019 RepID=A0A812BMU4_ACAPH|nr:unnamed protein product [Sepia pharaonis]
MPAFSPGISLIFSFPHTVFLYLSSHLTCFLSIVLALCLVIAYFSRFFFTWFRLYSLCLVFLFCLLTFFFLSFSILLLSSPFSLICSIPLSHSHHLTLSFLSLSLSLSLFLSFFLSFPSAILIHFFYLSFSLYLSLAFFFKNLFPSLFLSFSRSLFLAIISLFFLFNFSFCLCLSVSLSLSLYLSIYLSIYLLGQSFFLSRHIFHSFAPF